MSLSVQVEQKEPLLEQEEQGSTLLQKFSSALFYAFTSFMITVVNKQVLTSYAFPSFQAVALGQMVTTIVVLQCAKKMRILTFPDLHRKTFSQLSPLPFIYVANMIFGLGGTKELSLPMFTMLRRFSILMTMIAEYWILDVVPKLSVKISIGFMILGAVIAASGDLGFVFEGYVFVLLSDVLTASSGVYTKKILSSNKEMGKYGLMYYCALFMAPFAFFTILVLGEVAPVVSFPGWHDPIFILQFLGSCCMGFVLNYSIVFCTHHNSALTTTIMGCLKNILVTYLGMFIGGDYIFSVTNFVGINLSIIGSLLYTYVIFKPSPSKGSHCIKV
ncbi:UDP-sugar transporter UST74c [Cimex lectularius]|uniref:Sugar phosphate transporter domain-containing protein n=1 Tax=Cimex lectularius TaxID=79782 RepID=A0A8I6SBU9_CIMLE|nr:UDP-sugar transporter UST74c [Cimex lectularius]